MKNKLMIAGILFLTVFFSCETEDDTLEDSNTDPITNVDDDTNSDDSTEVGDNDTIPDVDTLLTDSIDVPDVDTTSVDSVEVSRNYVLKNGNEYPLVGAKLIAGEYDGGPSYFTSIYLYGEDVEFNEESDEVNAFTGQGTGCFIWFSSEDSLADGSYQIGEGWVGFDDFNFDNPEGNIYDMNNLPSNFMYLYDLNVTFSDNGNNNVTLKIDTDDIKLSYTGDFEWLD